MERKIGEIFEFGGEWYQCVIGCYCSDCAFKNDNCEERERITLTNKLTKEETTGLCTSELRSDGTSVIFKKLEKVGEPYLYEGALMQPYKRATGALICNWNSGYLLLEHGDSDIIDIEIKQNKEDMEEKKLNLKPFDIQKAREGKPVCTRDGRKARIICSDRIDAKPILALVPSTDGKSEDVFDYFVSGKRIANALESDLDLMMLPEKKEGWVNLYKSSSYSTKEEAIKYRNKCNDYIDTIKINWEE